MPYLQPNNLPMNIELPKINNFRVQLEKFVNDKAEADSNEIDWAIDKFLQVNRAKEDIQKAMAPPFFDVDYIYPTAFNDHPEPIIPNGIHFHKLKPKKYF